MNKKDKTTVLRDRNKPTMQPIDTACIPDELKAVNRWVGWRFEWKAKSWAKVPVNARTGHKCDATNSTSWTCFDEAITAVSAGRCDGIGFALGDGFAGGDLDDCRDPDTGELNALALGIIAEMRTYCEISPTGTGVKLLCKGTLKPKHKTKNKAGTVEIYTGGRFFCITGGHVPGTPQTIEDRQAELPALWERLIGSESKQTLKSEAARAPSAGIDSQALAAMLTAAKNMEDTNDGSKRLFVALCRTKDHDLTVERALATIREYARQRSFPIEWTDDQIRERLDQVEARDDVVRGSAVTITNYREIEVTDKSGETKKIILPLSMSEIIENIRRHAKDWPRRVDNMLFIEGEHGIDYFDRRTTAGLFGWLRRQFIVKWKDGGSFVSTSELFAEIERTAPRYIAIELLPHEKPIDNIYYRWPAPPAGDGSHLRWLLDRFRPETTADRELIRAAFITPFWGGPPGSRPAFTITSDDGRGVGKSIVAQIVGYVCGGTIDASANEDIGGLKTRPLTPGARTKRVGQLDNVKTLRFSWADFEALITSPTISGKQLYVGEGQRPNLLTWFITLNGVAMSTDMAQRSIIIKILRGENAGPWLEDTLRFIDEHRQAIIGDIVAALRAEQKPLLKYSRWSTWEQHVLCRLQNPDEIQRLYLERQGEANCELEEAQIIEQHFAEELSKLGHDAATAQIRIPVAMAATWFSEAVGERTKTTSASKRLNQMAKEGQMKCISPDASRHYGRCFIWTGPAANVVGERIVNDLVGQHKENPLKIARNPSEAVV